MNNIKKQLNESEFKLLAHTLGIDLEDIRKSLRYTRNYFSASDSHSDIKTLISLEEKGLIFRYEKFGGQVFSVTQKGQDLFKVEYFNKY